MLHGHHRNLRVLTHSVPTRRPSGLSMSAPSSSVPHEWFGLSLTASPTSGTAGNSPPAVQPPLEAENSVRTRAPLRTRTPPVVRATPSSAIGRAHVCTPVTHEHLVCRLLLEKKKKAHTAKRSI